MSDMYRTKSDPGVVANSVLGLILGQGVEWKNKSEKSLKEWEIQLV